ncbi:MAG: ABC transporter permease [Pirellulaceae bacterium]|jgi:putative ABC transport system permease protein|nr:ABC transporter permease [Pirellulaceae bacterium]
MNLAAKDIQHNFGRFALTALGIGMLLMIVMGMGGIYRGLIEDATLLVDRIGADLWIVQRDTRGPFAEISRVPRSLVYRALAVPGVESAREFLFHTIQRQHHGKPLRMSVLGLSWPLDKGEWLPLVAGRPLAQNHFEMVADTSLGLRLGEQIALGKDLFTIVGITTGMVSSGGDGMAFVTVWDAQAIQFDMPGEAIRLERAARERRSQTQDVFLSQPALGEQLARPTAELPGITAPQLSAVVVQVAHAADSARVAAVMAAWDDISVFTRSGQEDLLVQGMVDKARRQLGMFRVLLTAIATIVMALILYTLTLDKLHSIALLKLIGAPNRVILGLILQQALVLGSVGYGIAYVVGQQLFPRFPRRVVLTNPDLVQLAVIVLVISVLASLVGIWKALRVEPNEALMG